VSNIFRKYYELEQKKIIACLEGELGQQGWYNIFHLLRLDFRVFIYLFHEFYPNLSVSILLSCRSHHQYDVDLFTHFSHSFSLKKKTSCLIAMLAKKVYIISKKKKKNNFCKKKKKDC
jgi:hypothetical protein